MIKWCELRRYNNLWKGSIKVCLVLAWCLSLCSNKLQEWLVKATHKTKQWGKKQHAVAAINAKTSRKTLHLTKWQHSSKHRKLNSQQKQFAPQKIWLQPRMILRVNVKMIQVIACKIWVIWCKKWHLLSKHFHISVTPLLAMKTLKTQRSMLKNLPWLMPPVTINPAMMVS